MGQDSHTLDRLWPNEVGISNMPLEPLAGGQTQTEKFSLWSNDRGKAMLTSSQGSSERERCREFPVGAFNPGKKSNLLGFLRKEGKKLHQEKI